MNAHSAESDATRLFTAAEVIEIANETSDSFGNLYRLDFIDRIRHEARETSPAPDAEKDAPTMSRAECQCPDDCDCDGRFACEVQPSGCDGTWTCELVVGHDGWHQDGSHRWWAPCVLPPGVGA